MLSYRRVVLPPLVTLGQEKREFLIMFQGKNVVYTGLQHTKVSPPPLPAPRSPHLFGLAVELQAVAAGSGAGAHGT